jgi:uncharacterized membrane protein (DUF485 family)
MDLKRENEKLAAVQVSEDFNWGSTITVLVLLLAFVGASFYVLVSSYMDI